jgi:hypothetical protein
MKIYQKIWTAEKGWIPAFTGGKDESVQLVLFFGSTQILKQKILCQEVKQAYPNAHFCGCSTAGEIAGTQVLDNSFVLTAICFESTGIQGAQVELSQTVDSYKAGQLLAQSLETNGLRHVMVFSDGICVNGSDLVRGLTEILPAEVSITGGLAGDGERFEETLVCWDGLPRNKIVCAFGLYGNKLKVGYGSQGGWDPFGPERIITKSKGNILYELDGKSALDLYKLYLGEQASELPATGLLFPLSLRRKDSQTSVVRTILSVNEEEQSMTFAGDVPEGSYARLMKANFDRLIDGAIEAATKSYTAIGSFSPELAILISCVGRKMILKQRTEEEIEGVRDIFGEKTIITGFYSYGELSPFKQGGTCALHNQTMTITVLSEN